MAENLGESQVKSQQAELTVGKRLRNLLIVLVAIALSVALFFGLQSQNNSVSLTAFGEDSTPL